MTNVKQKDWLIVGGLVGAYFLFVKKAAATTEEGAAAGGGFDVLGSIFGALQDMAAKITNIPNIGEKGLPLQTDQRVLLDTLKHFFEPKATIATVIPRTTLLSSPNTAAGFVSAMNAARATAALPTMNIGTKPSVIMTPTANIPIVREPQRAGGIVAPVILFGAKPASYQEYNVARNAIAATTGRLSSSQQLQAARMGLSNQDYARRYG